MTRFLLPVLIGIAAAHVQAASKDLLCREAWEWAQHEYYQPVEEQAFLAACPSSLDQVLNKYSALVQIEPPASSGKQALAGIGLEIGLKGGFPTVLEAYEGFPAAKAKVQKRDLVLGIDGVSTKGMALSEVAKALRGEANSTLKLTLRRDGKKLTTPAIVRQIIVLPTVLSEEVKPGFLWVRVARFETTTIRDVVDTLMARRRAKDKEPLNGLIFDFRRNPGGRLDSALALAAAFLPEDAPLIRMQAQGGKGKTIQANDREAFDRAEISRLPQDLKSLPLIALMDQGSAAASEIVAGTWQAYGKALVIGRPSFGKNTIETVRFLQNQANTYLKLTSAVWTYLDGRSVAGQGLAPDVRFGGDADVPDIRDATIALALSKLEERRQFVHQELSPALKRVAGFREKFDREAALGELNRVLAIVPDALPARYYRALTLAELGQASLARRDREVFIRLAKTWDDNESLILGEPKQATERMYAERIDPVNCWTGIFTGDYALAETACLRLTSGKPTDASAWINLGHLALLKGDEKGAWHLYRTAMSMLGTYWPVSLEAVQEDFKLLVQPTFLPEGLMPARIRAIQAQFEEEQQAIASAIGSTELDMLRYMEGKVEKTLSQEEAQILLEKILKEEEKLLPSNHPRVLKTLERLGIAHLKEKNYSQAMSYFQQSLAGYRGLHQPQERLPFLEKAVKYCELQQRKAAQ